MAPPLCSSPDLNLVVMIRKIPTSFHHLQRTKQGLAAGSCTASHTHCLERQMHGVWGQQEYPFCIFQSRHNFAIVSRLWNFKVIWKHTVFQLSGNIQFSSYLEITSCDKGRYNLLCYLFEQYSPFISGEVLHTIKQRVRHNIKAYNLEVTELQNYTII